MNRKWQKLLILCSVFTLCVAGLFSSNMMMAKADDDVTYSPDSVFTTTAVDTLTDGEYLGIGMYDSSTFQYKKDMALKWYDGGTVDDVNYFSLTINFGSTIEFETASLKIQTERYSKATKDVQDNEILFSYDSVSNTMAVKVNDGVAHSVANFNDDIKIELSNEADGVYDVKLNNNIIGEFDNIGAYYSKATSTSSKSIVPLTLKVAGVGTDSSRKQFITIKEFNGQSFALTSGRIVDNTPPVLVISEPVKSMFFGAEFNYDYYCLDVISGNLTSTVKNSTENPDGTVNKVYYLDMKFYALTEDGDADITVDNYLDYTEDMIFFDKIQYKETDNAYVDIFFNLTDKSDNDTKVYLGWYAESGCYTQQDGSTNKYLTVTNDTQGPAFKADYADAVEFEAMVDDYQLAVEEAAEGLNVGTNSYFYLPVIGTLINDNAVGYRSLTYTIYYKTDSTETQTASSLSYSNLKLTINDAGTYTFKVVATDSFDNPMIVDDGFGNMVKVDSNNVWKLNTVPDFHFTVGTLLGPEISESNAQDSAYANVLYSVSSFEVTAIAGYKNQASLYVFSPDAAVAETAKTATYESLVDGSFFESTNLSYSDYLSKYWRAVEDYSEPTEDEKDYEDELYPDNVYEWSADSLSFIPKEGDEYYLVTYQVYDNFGLAADGSKVILLAKGSNEVVGDINWFNDNIVSVILLSIACLAAIGIIILWVTKPREKVFDEVTTGSGKKVYRSKKQAQKDIDLDDQD